MTAGVYLNGIKLAEHAGGYSTFRVDITKAVREAEGRTLELAVSVNIRFPASPSPAACRFPALPASPTANLTCSASPVTEGVWEMP